MTKNFTKVDQVVVSSEPAQEGVFGIHQVVQIRPSPDNRKRFNETALQELAASVKADGVAQPILIRPVEPTAEQPEIYEIVAGERRWRASRIAGLETIPAMVRSLDNLQAAKIRILENLQREDPHPLEEAEGYEQLMLRHGYSADQLAEEIKKSRAYVYGRLKLCALTTDVREQFLDNKISASTALLIARIPVPALQVRALTEITSTSSYTNEPMSYRRAVEHVQGRYMLDLAAAIFPMGDAKLLATAGSCTACPKRTGNQPEIFTGISADVCTDPDCFSEKRAALHAQTIVNANKKKIPILEGEEARLALRKQSLSDSELVTGQTQLLYFARNAPATKNHGIPEKILGTLNMPRVAAYIKDSDGSVIPMYDRTAMQEALEKSGVCETIAQHQDRMADVKSAGGRVFNGHDMTARDARDAAEREIKDKGDEIAERETSFRVSLYKKMRARMASNGLSLDSLREFVKLILLDFNDYCLPNDLLDVYGLASYSDDSVCAYIDRAALPEVQLILVDLVLGECLGVGLHNISAGAVDQDDRYDALLSMARHEGIDPDEVREELFAAPAVAIAAEPEQEDAPDAADQLATQMAEASAKPASGKNLKVKLAPAAAWPFPEHPVTGEPGNAVDAAPAQKSVLSPAAAWPFPKSSGL